MRDHLHRSVLFLSIAIGVVTVPVAHAQQPGLGQVGQPISDSPPDAFWIGGALFLSVILDSEIRDVIRPDTTGGVSDGLADVGNTFGTIKLMIPALAAVWAGATVAKKPGVSGVVGRALLSAGLSGATVFALKSLVGRIRPADGGEPDSFRPFRIKDSSFPSGHTALAFSLATSFARETHDRGSDVLFYGLATMTGFARMNDDRHWFSDVVAGGIIGYLSAQVITPSRNGVSVGATPGGVGLRYEF